jgi:hypothetical protein
VKTKTLRGFLAKLREQAGFGLVDWSGGSRSVGSGSNGCGGLRRRGLDLGVGFQSGGWGLAHAARRRHAKAGGGRRRTRRREPRSRVSGHGLGRGGRLGEAREHANLSRAAALAKTRRRRRPTRRRGARTPETALGRRGAWGRRHVMPAGSSPPCASLVRLLDDEAMAAAKPESGGAAISS